MDKVEKYEMIQKVLRELEDLRNNETSVLKKITEIEADNSNLNIGLLDKTLPDIHESVDNIIRSIDLIIYKFTEHRNQFARDNRLQLFIQQEKSA